MLIETAAGKVLLEKLSSGNVHFAIVYEPSPDTGHSKFPSVNLAIYPIVKLHISVAEIVQAYVEFFPFPECYKKLVELGIINDKI